MNDKQTLLAGYMRTRANGDLKVSINLAAINDCGTYTTSDGQTWVPLTLKRTNVDKVLRGERAVTTIFSEVSA